MKKNLKAKISRHCPFKRVEENFLPFQTIYPGEEISENYYPVVQVMPRADRRAWLSEYYRYRRIS
jgi:hypothetical protein